MKKTESAWRQCFSFEPLENPENKEIEREKNPTYL